MQSTIMALSARSSLLLIGSLMAASLVVGGGTAVYGYPTGVPVWGPSGLGVMPTTDTVPASVGEVGLSYERVKPEFGGRVRYLPALSGNYGFRNGEVGAGYLKERFTAPGFALDTSYWTVHGKYRFWQHQRSGAALAAGAHYVKFSSLGGNVTSFYAAGSYPLLRRPDRRGEVVGHLGLFHQRIRAGLSDSVTRPMIGVEYRASPQVTVAADYVARSGPAVRAMSVVARYEAPSGWGAQIGMGRFRQSDEKVFASVVYRFGGRGAVAPPSPTEVQR